MSHKRRFRSTHTHSALNWWTPNQLKCKRKVEMKLNQQVKEEVQVEVEVKVGAEAT